MCIRDREQRAFDIVIPAADQRVDQVELVRRRVLELIHQDAVSYTHLRAHETVLDLVCRLLLEKKKKH